MKTKIFCLALFLAGSLYLAHVLAAGLPLITN